MSVGLSSPCLHTYFPAAVSRAGPCCGNEQSPFSVAEHNRGLFVAPVTCQEWDSVILTSQGPR